jgi:hypothetical protein
MGVQAMATSVRKVLTKRSMVSDREILFRLAANAEDAQALELLVDRHRWIIEEEVSHRFGRPPWFDSALATVLTEIVRGAANCNPQKQRATEWIRREARRAGRTLEHTIADEHATDGFIKFSSCEANLTSLVTCLLERSRSPYWNDLFPRKPLRRPAQRFY